MRGATKARRKNATKRGKQGVPSREMRGIRAVYRLLLSAGIAWGCLASAGRLAVHGQTLASVKETQFQATETAAVPLPDAVAPSPSPDLWGTYLWEAIPPEWLRDRRLSLIPETYQEHGWTPFFIDSRFRVDPDVELLLARIEKIREENLDPRPYRLDELRQLLHRAEQLRLSLPDLGPEYGDSSLPAIDRPASTQTGQGSESSSVVKTTAASGLDMEDVIRQLFQVGSAVDIHLSRCVVRFGDTMNPFSRELQSAVLLHRISMNEFLEAVEPPSPQYQILLKELARYRRLAAESAQQKLAFSATLRPGDTGNEVRLLQKRLQQEGYYDGKINGHFDEATRHAVKQFQIHHAMEPDGAVGRETLQKLNISFQEKAVMVEQGLKQLRESETRRYNRFVRINIPQFLLEYHKDGQVSAVHRVIVGKASGKKVKLNGRWMGENQTPTLSSNIERVVINPRWIVSDRIRQELSSEIAADPTYLTRHGYDQMSSSPYPWGEPRLFQRPGPTNPLGRVKFEFPNGYAVFLHDTPKKHLFNRSRRDFSHGCIRVENAQELAQKLLEDDQNPAAARTESYLSTFREAYLKLQQPVPIIIEYAPATVSSSGHVVFAGDPYGWLQPTSDPRS